MLSCLLRISRAAPQRRLPRLAAGPAMLAALGMTLGAPAQAALSDTIHPFVSVSRNYDANLFRLADETPDLAGPRDDSSTMSQAGLLLDRPIGRQHLTGQFKVSRVAFAHYDQLDYNGKDMLADLEWHLGNHLDGHLGSSYNQTLTSFSDFHISQRNLRVQRREYVDGSWTFHPSWRVRGAYSTQKTTYDLASQAFNDRTEDGSSLGLDYLASSSSRIGVQLGRSTGRYPNHLLFGLIPIDDSYTQDEAKLNVLWVFSATSQFQMLAGHTRRKHSFFTERDSGGVKGRGVFNWSMLRKLRMTATGWREFAAVESASITNSVNTGASLTGAWDIGAKLAANATVKQEHRDFLTVPGATPLYNLDDRTRTVSGGLDYAPLDAVRLGVDYFRETRSGSIVTNYHTHGVAVRASVQF